MILKTITCDVEGCQNSHTEERFNAGHPRWGHVAGIMDPETGAEMAHLCPEHMEVIKALLSGKRF